MSVLDAPAYMRKSLRALAEAQLLLREASPDGACSRAYYAMFDAAHAALIAAGFETSEAPIKTHHGLIVAFGKHLVLSGQVRNELGRALNMVQDTRQLADYGANPPSLPDAAWCVEQAEAFVAAIRTQFGL